MDQFKIYKVADIQPFGLDISLTNASLTMIATTFLIILLLSLSSRRASIIPNKIQILGEALYKAVLSIIRSAINDEAAARKQAPLIFTVFTFVLFANIFGLFPFSFTTTSHIAATGALAGVVFIAMILNGIISKGPIGFITSLCPSGVPIPMVPLIFVIELITYCARPLTLSIRLAANMTAGHTMLKVIIGFTAKLGVLAIIPMLVTSVITGFELFVACLQSYIFAMLASIYLNEAISKAH